MKQNIKVLFKRFKLKFTNINSFCKCCGNDIDDFLVDDETWSELIKTAKEKKYIASGNSLCGSCFLHISNKEAIPCVLKNIPAIDKL